MDPKQIILKYYTALQDSDSKKMNSYLSDDIIFDDTALGTLKGTKVKYWWQFVCENMVDLSTKIKKIELEKDYYIVSLTNQYTFKETGNKVSLNVISKFYFKDNLIIKQIDGYELKSFVKQAFGSLAAKISSFIIEKTVRTQSRRLLKTYIKKNDLNL